VATSPDRFVDPSAFVVNRCLHAHSHDKAVILPIAKSDNRRGWKRLAWVLWFVIVPGVAILGATLFVRLNALDLTASHLFYSKASAGWPLLRVQPWKALYDFGPLPGLILGIAAAIVVIFEPHRPRLEPWKSSGLFVLISLLVGPGLLVNGILKPFWPRPRPNQITEFGGPLPYVQAWEAYHAPDDAKSFPSGHASMGFFLMTPAFLIWRRYPGYALAFLLLGLGMGSAIGLARVVQGRHFASDVLWSAAAVYYSNLLCYRLLGGPQFGECQRDRTIEPAAGSGGLLGRFRRTKQVETARRAA
jgi:lipid A 4'-phosphatase